MSRKTADPLRFADHARYIPGQEKGHYESYFLRANHPKKPVAFWIRYTVFAPRGRPEDAIGEVWAVYFDGEKQEHVAVKDEFPMSVCAFNTNGLAAKVGECVLDHGKLSGEATAGQDKIAWEMGYGTESEPLFLLPLKLYNAPFPKAKALVPRPMAAFTGKLVVNGKYVPVKDWVGSQNHNWGEKHTDDYAWGQVAGFDDAPDSFLEIATGRIRLGPVWTPYMSPMVLRHNGRQYALNSLVQTVKARGSFDYFDWKVRSDGPEFSMEARITAPRESFVCLNYYNPPGGVKHCLNSKIASCRLTLMKKGGKPEVLNTENRAAFEILTDDRDHGVAVRV
ncbi:MAG: hypothetical protein ACLFOY_01950 [Desulfatibacillaceae bacterium]